MILSTVKKWNKHMLLPLLVSLALAGCEDKDKGKQTGLVETAPVPVAQASGVASKPSVAAEKPQKEKAKPVKANCGSGGKRFVKKNDSKTAKCEVHQGEESETQECAFPGTNLRQAYDILKKLHPDLKEVLPAKDVEYSCQENELESRRITYKHKSKKHLLIEIEYIDGEEARAYDSIDILENKNGTKAKIYFRG